MSSKARLASLSVSPTHGFLNPSCASVLSSLPPEYSPVISITRSLGTWLHDDKLRAHFDAAPVTAIPPLDDASLSVPQRRALFQVFSLLASGYVFSIYSTDGTEVKKTLPASLAIPLHELAGQISVPAILNYDAYVLNNWVRASRPARDCSGSGGNSSCDGDVGNDEDYDPFNPESYEPIFTFSSPADPEHAGERWFIAVHVAVERMLGEPVARLGEMGRLVGVLAAAVTGAKQTIPSAQPVPSREADIDSDSDSGYSTSSAKRTCLESSVAATSADATSRALGIVVSEDMDVQGATATLSEFLPHLASRLRLAARTLGRMPERLSPLLYADTTRRYVQPFEGIVFSGVTAPTIALTDDNGGCEDKVLLDSGKRPSPHPEEHLLPPQHLRGETGGQSPLARALGAFLGLGGRACRGNRDMGDLARYMWPGHQEFIAEIAGGDEQGEEDGDDGGISRPPEVMSLHAYLALAGDRAPQAIVDGFRDVVEALAEFRSSHMRLAAMYLSSKGLDTGTGRSQFARYLGGNLRETKALLKGYRRAGGELD